MEGLATTHDFPPKEKNEKGTSKVASFTSGETTILQKKGKCED